MASHIAIIPARSGSKGLPHKNIKPLCGQPLLAYTIQAAQKSQLYDEIFVSTDSEEYAAIARSYHASVPFLRDESLAGDLSSSWDVVKHDLSRYQALGREFDCITLLQPTSPLRTSDDLRGAFALMQSKHAKGIVSVTEAEHSPLLCNTLPSNHCMNHFIDSCKIGARQTLDTYYRINGAIYMLDTNYLFHHNNFYTGDCFAYVMPKERSIDIDDLYDFTMAEALLTKKIE